MVRGKRKRRKGGKRREKRKSRWEWGTRKIQQDKTAPSLETAVNMSNCCRIILGSKSGEGDCYPVRVKVSTVLERGVLPYRG